MAPSPVHPQSKHNKEVYPPARLYGWRRLPNGESDYGHQELTRWLPGGRKVTTSARR